MREWPVLIRREWLGEGMHKVLCFQGIKTLNSGSWKVSRSCKAALLPWTTWSFI
jgi:hypothetical protein